MKALGVKGIPLINNTNNTALNNASCAKFRNGTPNLSKINGKTKITALVQRLSAFHFL